MNNDQPVQIVRNSTLSVLQALVNIFVLFFLYRYLISKLGENLVGVWSLTTAATSMFSVAQFGFTRSLVKYVAKYKAKDDFTSISNLIQTVFISLAIIIGVVCLIAYPVLYYLLDFIIKGKEILVARDILVWVIIMFFIRNIAAIFQSSLDGLQRMDIRGIIVISSVIVFFVSTIIMVPEYGIKGVLFAQLLQYVVVFVVSVICIKLKYKDINLFPRKWKRELFSEAYLYGIKFQFISVCQVLTDPITKAFLSRFGGLNLVTYYEMAYKMSAHARLLVVFANGAIVPAVAEYIEKTPELIKRIYKRSNDIIFLFSFSVFPLIVLSSPIISKLWIGEINNYFVLFAAILAGSVLFSTISMPAFQVNMGTGNLKANVVSNIVLAVTNLVLGSSLGFYFGGIGVVAGFAFATALSGITVLWIYFKENSLNIRDLISIENSRFFYITQSLFVILTVILIFLSSFNLFLVINALAVVAYIVILIIVFWQNSYKNYLFEKIVKNG